MAVMNITRPRPARTPGSTKTRMSKQPGHHAGSIAHHIRVKPKDHPSEELLVLTGMCLHPKAWVRGQAVPGWFYVSTAAEN
jgi:hypothetical protein